VSKSIKKIAADLSSNTLAAAKRALKEAGLKQTLAPDVLAAKEEIEAARAAKRDHLSALRQRRRTGRAPVLTPAGTPAQRLERKISRAQPSCTQHNALVGDLKTPPEGTQ
jgi:hypothetical protein